MDLQETIAALYRDAAPRLRERFAHLEQALAAGDVETAAAEAHTLTGTLGTFGRHDASDAARGLEGALRSGGDPRPFQEALRLAL